MDTRYITNQDAASIFATCRAENRVLVTQSRSLARRKAAPCCILLREQNFLKATIQLCEYLGISFDRTRFYSVCYVCNQPFVKILLSQFADHHDVKNHKQAFVDAMVEQTGTHSSPELSSVALPEFGFWCQSCNRIFW